MRFLSFICKIAAVFVYLDPVKSYELSIRLFLCLSLSISSLSFDDLLFAALVSIWLQLSNSMTKIKMASGQIRLGDRPKSGQIVSFTCLFHKKHAFLRAKYAIRHSYIISDCCKSFLCDVLIHKSSSCLPLSVVFTSSSLPIFQVNFLFSLFSYIRTIVKGTMLALITLPGLSTIESKRGWVGLRHLYCCHVYFI